VGVTVHLTTTTLIEKTTRTFYALKTLRVHGLIGEATWDVTHATVISQLLYESPPWWGYLKSDEKSVSNPILTKHIVTVTCQVHAKHSLSWEINLTNLFHSAVNNPNHILHRRLPLPPYAVFMRIWDFRFTLCFKLPSVLIKSTTCVRIHKATWFFTVVGLHLEGMVEIISYIQCDKVWGNCGQCFVKFCWLLLIAHAITKGVC